MASARTLQVGLFTESYAPVVNGVSTSVKTLSQELEGLGHSPVVVAPHFKGYDDIPGVPVVRLPSWRTVWNPQNPFAYPPLPFWTPAPLREPGCRFDVVHTQQPFGMGLHGKATARRLQVPLVSTFHTLYTEYAHYFPVVPSPIAHRWLVGVLRGYYTACDAVIVPSREAGRRLEAIGVPSNLLHAVPTGVDAAAPVSPHAIAEVRSTYAIAPDAPILLFVGRLAREKNLELLFASFADILQTGKFATPPVLLLAGSGPWREACETLARQTGVSEQVRFAGFVSRQNLPALYSAATVFAFPSPTETQGVVLSEAQSYGLPCVVVEGGGASEFVRDGVDALVVPPNKKAFTRALMDLLSNEPKRAAFAQAARNSDLRPTPAGMAQKILSVYTNARQNDVSR